MDDLPLDASRLWRSQGSKARTVRSVRLTELAGRSGTTPERQAHRWWAQRAHATAAAAAQAAKAARHARTAIAHADNMIAQATIFHGWRRACIRAMIAERERGIELSQAEVALNMATPIWRHALEG